MGYLKFIRKTPPQTHSLKYWLSVLWGIKRISKNNQATGWIHRTPCEQLQGIIEEIKKIKLEEGECLTSYDVSALFTSIPISSALDIINNKLQEDTDLHNRTNMTTHNIIELLDFF